MSSSKSVFVTGATGKQGGAVARALLDRGHEVVALTRDDQSHAAQVLSSAGAAIVRGDFDHPVAMLPHLGAVDALFLMATPFGQDVEQEVRHATGMIDAARAAGVLHLVYSSVVGASGETGARRPKAGIS